MTIRELAAYVYGLTPMHPGKWRVIHTLLPRRRSSEWHITRINSAQMAVDTGSVMGEHLFYGRAHERWETEQARRIIRSGDVVLDIGANIGYYSVLFSQLVGSGQVYAFEPSTRNLPVLRENLRRNRIENVQVVEAALSDRRGVANLGGNTLDTLRIGDDYRGESVTGDLDEWAEAADLRCLDFVKADIEGHEIPMLRGGSPRDAARSMFLESRGVRLELGATAQRNC